MAKNIGEVLREARRAAGLSTRDLERLTGMSTASLSQIETGARRDPGFGTVLKLARAIGISMEDLARRLEGRAAGQASQGASIARALADIERAKNDARRIEQRLIGASASLTSQTSAPSRKTSRKRA